MSVVAVRKPFCGEMRSEQADAALPPRGSGSQRMQLMSVVAVGLGVCMWRTIYLVVQVVCKPFRVPWGTIFDRY